MKAFKKDKLDVKIYDTRAEMGAGAAADIHAKMLELLAEKDEWLKKTAVKTLVIVFIFGAIDAALDLIPGAISVISSIFELFNRPFHMNFVTNLVYTVENILSFFRNILLIAMSVMALAKNAPEFGPVDDMVKKHTTDLEDED